MATIQEAVRRLTVESTSKGVKQTTEDLKQLGQAHSGVTVESQKTERATQSMERRLQSIQRQYDRNFRVTQQMARIERDLNAAQAQGLITATRKNQLLALAAASHNTAATATGRHAAALTALNARMAMTSAMLPRMLAGSLGLGGGLGGALLGGAFITNSIEQEKAMAQLEAVIRSTGGAAGLSAGELARFASEMQRVTAFGDEAVMSAQALMLTFTRIGKEVFPQATEAVLNVSTAMNQGIKESAVQIGKALNDPIQGIAALRRVGIQFTTSQQQQIKAAVEAGNALEAQRIILRELEVQFGGSARAARDTLGGAFTGLRNAIGDLFEVPTENTVRFRGEIERLTNFISDPSTQSAFQSFGAGIMGTIADAASDARDAYRGLALVWRDIKSLNLGEIFQQGSPMADARFNLRAGIGTRTSFREFGPLDRAIAQTGQPRRTAPGADPTSDQIREAERTAEFLRRANEQRQTAINMLHLERDAIFLTEEAAMKLRLEEEQLARLRERGIAETPALRAEIEQWAETYARVAEENRQLQKWTDIGRDTFKSFFTDFRAGLKSGENGWEAFKNAGVNALDRLSSRIMDMVLDNGYQTLMGGFGGAGGGQGNPWMAAAPRRGGLLGGFLIPGILHSGGMVGSAPSSGRYVHPAYFDGLPRYHDGGVIGPRERLIVAEDDEEVLTRDDPRHRWNGGNKGESVVVQMSLNNDFRGASPDAVASIGVQLQKLQASIPNMVVQTIEGVKRSRPEVLR